MGTRCEAGVWELDRVWSGLSEWHAETVECFLVQELVGRELRDDGAGRETG
jgi:hypothetical protein